MPLSGQQARICFAQKLLDLNKSTKRLLEAWSYTMIINFLLTVIGWVHSKTFSYYINKT